MAGYPYVAATAVPYAYPTAPQAYAPSVKYVSPYAAPSRSAVFTDRHAVSLTVSWFLVTCLHSYYYCFFIPQVLLLFFLANWYFIPRGVKTKQIGEISGMVIIIIIIIFAEVAIAMMMYKRFWPDLF